MAILEPGPPTFFGWNIFVPNSSHDPVMIHSSRCHLYLALKLMLYGLQKITQKRVLRAKGMLHELNKWRMSQKLCLTEVGRPIEMSSIQNHSNPFTIRQNDRMESYKFSEYINKYVYFSKCSPPFTRILLLTPDGATPGLKGILMPLFCRSKITLPTSNSASNRAISAFLAWEIASWTRWLASAFSSILRRWVAFAFSRSW